MPKTVVSARIISNTLIGPAVKEMVFHAPEIAVQAVPGQFVHVKPADNRVQPLLRRPISISDIDTKAGTISFIYRIVGEGTAILAALKADDYLDCMGPLGNGFNLKCTKPLLVGGGMGLAPLVNLAGALGPKPEILMGGRNKAELFWVDIFDKVASKIHITTDDGSLGKQGFTLDVLPELLKSGEYDMIYTCGPRVMIEGVAKLAYAHNIPCQVSLEDYMACGVGACLSCTCAGTDGSRKKVCTDGPVFWAEEVI